MMNARPPFSNFRNFIVLSGDGIMVVGPLENFELSPRMFHDIPESTMINREISGEEYVLYSFYHHDKQIILYEPSDILR